jgi:hypothetical protein
MRGRTAAEHGIPSTFEIAILALAVALLIGNLSISTLMRTHETSERCVSGNRDYGLQRIQPD